MILLYKILFCIGFWVAPSLGANMPEIPAIDYETYETNASLQEDEALLVSQVAIPEKSVWQIYVEKYGVKAIACLYSVKEYVHNVACTIQSKTVDFFSYCYNNIMP